MKLYFIVILITAFFLPVFSQSGQISPCKIKNNVFQSGEKLHYILTYNWFFVWTDVGKITFEASNDSINKQKVINLKATGVTFSFYDWFYQVRDIYQSWVQPENLLPVYYHRDIDEDGYLMDIKYSFDYDNMLAYTEVDKPRRDFVQDTIPLPECAFDVVSLIYKARGLNFNEYKIDEKIPFKILLDNEIHDVYIRYKGKEARKIKGLGKFNTIKFTGSLVAGDTFDGGENLVFWVTDDKNRIPLWIESPIKVGTVKVRLVGYENLMHHVKSLIEKK